MVRLLALLVSLALLTANVAGDSYAFCHILERVAASDDCCAKPSAPAVENDCCETRSIGTLPPAEPRPATIGIPPSTHVLVAWRSPSIVARGEASHAPPLAVAARARGAPERLAHLMRFLN